VTGYSVPEGVNGQKRILVVDDNASNRAVLRDTLEPLGFVIGEAKDGSEVLEGCKEFQPDVILMDLRMPMVDGFTATGQIKTDARFSHVPVIAVTASVAYQQNSGSAVGNMVSVAILTSPMSLLICLLPWPNSWASNCIMLRRQLCTLLSLKL